MITRKKHIYLTFAAILAGFTTTLPGQICYAQDANTSVQKIQDLAKSGDGLRQAELGQLHQFGEQLPLDYGLAAYWYEKAAIQNVPMGQYRLASLYATGLGVEKNFDKAAHLYGLAAQQGYTDSQFALGLIHEKKLSSNANPISAPKWYEKAALAGHSEAQVNLGVLYQEGKIIGQDYAQALDWYEKAAAQGNLRAQNNIGIIYTKGLGVDQDYFEAVKWYRLAAEGGLPKAMTNLGVMYENGFGVDQSDKNSIIWYRKAGQGDAKATKALNSDLTKLKPAALKKLAEQGRTDAQYQLGLLYSNGSGVPQDYVLGYQWLNLATIGGEKQASELRNKISQSMTPTQINEAQSLSRDWLKSNDRSK